MANPYEEAAKRAADLTDEKYASEISSLCRLKDEEINSLFPGKADKDKLLKLLKIVNDATNENQKVAVLTQNIGNLAGTVVKVVKFLYKF